MCGSVIKPASGLSTLLCSAPSVLGNDSPDMFGYWMSHRGLAHAFSRFCRVGFTLEAKRVSVTTRNRIVEGFIGYSVKTGDDGTFSFVQTFSTERVEDDRSLEVLFPIFSDCSEKQLSRTEVIFPSRFQIRPLTNVPITVDQVLGDVDKTICLFIATENGGLLHHFTKPTCAGMDWRSLTPKELWYV